MTKHKTDMNIIKIGKYKKRNYKVSKNKHKRSWQKQLNTLADKDT